MMQENSSDKRNGLNSADNREDTRPIKKRSFFDSFVPLEDEEMKENSPDQGPEVNSDDIRKGVQAKNAGSPFESSIRVSSCGSSPALRNLENLAGRSSILKKELQVDFKDAVLDELLRETSVTSHSTSTTPAEADVEEALSGESTNRLLNELDAIVGHSRTVKNEEVDAVDSTNAVLEELLQAAFPAQSMPKDELANTSHLAEPRCKLEATTPPLSQEVGATLEGDPQTAHSNGHAVETENQPSGSSSQDGTASTGDACSDSSTSPEAGSPQTQQPSCRKRSRPESPTPETYRRTRRTSPESSSTSTSAGSESGSPRRIRKPKPDSDSCSDGSRRRRPRRSSSTDSCSSFGSGDESPGHTGLLKKKEHNTSRESPCPPTVNAPIWRKPERPAVSSICDADAVAVSDESDIEVLEAPIGLERATVDGADVHCSIRSRPSQRVDRPAVATGSAALPSLLALFVHPPVTTVRPLAAVTPYSAQLQSQPVIRFQPTQYASPTVSQRPPTVPDWLRKDVPPHILKTFLLFPTENSHASSADVDVVVLGDESSLKPLLTSTDVLFGQRSKCSPAHTILNHYFTIYAADALGALKPCVHVLLHDLKPASFQRMWASVRQTLLDRFASVGSLPRATFHFIDQPTRNHLASVRKAFGDDVKPSWYDTSTAVCAKIEELSLLQSLVQEPRLAEWTRTLCGSVILPRQLSFRTDHLRRLPSTCAPGVASALFKLATWMNWDLLSAPKTSSEHRKQPDIMDIVIAGDEHLRFLAERFAESLPKLHQFLDFVHRLHAASVEKLSDLSAFDSPCSTQLRRRLAFEQTMRGISKAIRDVVAARDSVAYEDVRWFAERAGQLMAEVTA